MTEMQIKRPFQQRFLDGFDRSQLRQEVQKVKPRRFSDKLRNKYVTWALGASLAVGGIGAPLKVIHDSQEKVEQNRAPERAPAPAPAPAPARAAAVQPAASAPGDNGIVSDLSAAANIANEVAQGVTSGVQQAAKAPVQIAEAAPAAIAQVPRQIEQTAEAAKAEFFAKEVPFGSVIYQQAKKNNLNPELVAAVIQQESKFHPTARSGAGALGLMQLVPKTGRWMGASNLLNPVQNIAAGTKYLAYLSDRFNGNETNVIAAYNAGEGAVRRFGGIPPFHETQNYVSNVRNFQRDFADRAAGAATQIAQMR